MSDGPPSAERPARRVPRVPRVVLAAVVAFGALAAVWSVVAPLTEAPDEPAHLGLVLHLAAGGDYPDFDGLHTPQSVFPLCRTFGSATRACPRPGEEVTRTSFRLHPVADAPAEADRPGWADDGGAEPGGVANQMPQHPPLYYQAMATVLRVERALTGDSWSLARELALLRLVNALMLAPLPLLAWWTARRIGLGEVGALTATVGVFAVPMLTHIGSTLNNDSLLTLLGAVLAGLLAGVARGDRSLRTAGLVGLVCGLAVLTKAFGVVFPVAAAIAYAASLSNDTRGRGQPVASASSATSSSSATASASAGRRLVGVAIPVAIVGALTALVAGWWYVGNRVRHGSFTPTIEDERLSADLRPPGFEADLVDFLGRFAAELNVRFWGSFGWYTIRFPWWVALVATVAVVGVVVVGLLRSTRTAAASVLQRATLLVPVLLLGAFVLLRAWDLHTRTSTYPFIQGRYLFAGIVGVVVLAGVGLARLAPRRAPWIALGFSAVLQFEGLRRCVQGWWGGPGVGPGVGPWGQLRALTAWSGWPGPVVVLFAVALVAASAWLVVEIARTLRSGPSVTPPPPASAR